jgi:hypothetical protein
MTDPAGALAPSSEDPASPSEAAAPRAEVLPLLPALPSPERVVLPDEVPSIEQLFRFAREAELRVRSLRLVIEERRITARGEERMRHELWLRHPGQARVTTHRGGSSPSRDYDVWLIEGDTVTTYAPSRGVASRRRSTEHLVGIDDPGLPRSARQHAPLTRLPAGSLMDTFVHPHGLFRNVLLTGPLAVVGTRDVAGREAIVVRGHHPRTAKVLVDRPDRSLEVGIDRVSGFLVLVRERIGDVVTSEAQATELLIDPVVPPTAFELRLPSDVRMLY